MDKDLLIAVSLSPSKIKKFFLGDFSNNNNFQNKYDRYIKSFQEDIKRIKRYCQLNSVQIITLLDREYPEQLVQIADPPILLYAKGRVELLKKANAIGVVGSRKATRSGIMVCEKISSQLAEYGIVVISGLASGIDASAHRGTLNVGGDTIAVLGTGIETMYPFSNRDLYKEIFAKGLVVTEYAPETEFFKAAFPLRNRIIAGLSKGVLVVESAKKGGSLITAQCALDYNREIFAVPGRITDKMSSGTNVLIQQGAKMVLSVEDIASELNWLIPPKKQKVNIKYKLSKEENSVLQHLGLEPIYIDILQQKTGLKISKISTILSFLELQDIVCSLPGKFYIKNANLLNY